MENLMQYTLKIPLTWFKKITLYLFLPLRKLLRQSVSWLTMQKIFRNYERINLRKEIDQQNIVLFPSFQF